ncbi:unnamed protein product [Symbiodinium sp. CCMP2592]|nr:unnamed protein product [Symbiodinium sp. CCMP2592]
MPPALLELPSPITCESHLFSMAASLAIWSCCRRFQPTSLPSELLARLVGKRTHCKLSRRLHPALVCLVQHACESHLGTNPDARVPRIHLATTARFGSAALPCINQCFRLASKRPGHCEDAEESAVAPLFESPMV